MSALPLAGLPNIAQRDAWDYAPAFATLTHSLEVCGVGVVPDTLALAQALVPPLNV